MKWMWIFGIGNGIIMIFMVWLGCDIMYLWYLWYFIIDLIGIGLETGVNVEIIWIEWGCSKCKLYALCILYFIFVFCVVLSWFCFVFCMFGKNVCVYLWGFFLFFHVFLFLLFFDLFLFIYRFYSRVCFLCLYVCNVMKWNKNVGHTVGKALLLLSNRVSVIESNQRVELSKQSVMKCQRRTKGGRKIACTDQR